MFILKANYQLDLFAYFRLLITKQKTNPYEK